MLKVGNTYYQKLRNNNLLPLAFKESHLKDTTESIKWSIKQKTKRCHQRQA